MAKDKLTPEAWIAAGLDQLAAEGASALRAEPLARYLKTTKGSFYWHFKDVPAFQEALLASWSADAMGVLDGLKGEPGSPAERLIALGQAVQANAAESALRAWGHSDTHARAALAKIDDARMAYLSDLMAEMGNKNADFCKAAYGTVIGLRQMHVKDGDALVAFGALIDLVLSAG